MANTIFVDTDNLPGVITNITSIQTNLDAIKATMSGLSANLNLYLSGGAPVIATVEGNFVTTLTSLTAADTAITTLVGQLTSVQADAVAAITAL